MMQEKKARRQSRNFKKESIKIAKELRYPKHVIEELEQALSEDEINKILIQARHDSHEREMKEDGIKRTHRGNRC